MQPPHISFLRQLRVLGDPLLRRPVLQTTFASFWEAKVQKIHPGCPRPVVGTRRREWEAAHSSCGCSYGTSGSQERSAGRELCTALAVGMHQPFLSVSSQSPSLSVSEAALWRGSRGQPRTSKEPALHPAAAYCMHKPRSRPHARQGFTQILALRQPREGDGDPYKVSHALQGWDS